MFSSLVLRKSAKALTKSGVSKISAPSSSKKSMASVVRERDNLTAKLKKANSSLSTLQRQRVSLSSQLQASSVAKEAFAAELEGTASTLSGKNDLLELEVAKLFADLTTASASYESAKLQLAKEGTMNAQLTSEKLALSAVISEKEQAIHALQLNIAQLQKNASAAEADNTKLAKQVADALSGNESLGVQLEDVRSTLLREKRDLASQLKAAIFAHEALIEDLNNSTTDITALETENTQLVADLAAMTASRDELAARLVLKMRNEEGKLHPTVMTLDPPASCEDISEPIALPSEMITLPAEQTLASAVESFGSCAAPLGVFPSATTAQEVLAATSATREFEG